MCSFDASLHFPFVYKCMKITNHRQAKSERHQFNITDNGCEYNENPRGIKRSKEHREQTDGTTDRVFKKKRERERETERKKMIKRKQLRMLDSRKKGKACVSSNLERGLIAWKNGKSERFAARYAPFPVRFFADSGSSTILFRGGWSRDNVSPTRCSHFLVESWFMRGAFLRERSNLRHATQYRVLWPPDRSQYVSPVVLFRHGFVSNSRGCRFMRRPTIEGEFFAKWTAVVPRI